jgi:hypothetical protein
MNIVLYIPALQSLSIRLTADLSQSRAKSRLDPIKLKDFGLGRTVEDGFSHPHWQPDFFSIVSFNDFNGVQNIAILPFYVRYFYIIAGRNSRHVSISRVEVEALYLNHRKTIV